MSSKVEKLEWSEDALNALKNVPFFVRNKAKSRIEQYVRDRGINGSVVTIEDVKKAKEQFISGMSQEITGYQADRCFGASGCPNSANSCESLLKRAGKILEDEDILSFLKKNVKGDLKYHHEFRLSCSDCPNCCSQPQIKDFGIVGAVVPEVSDVPCTGCGSCESACPDSCIKVDYSGNTPFPEIDFSSCVMCGKCITACPTGTVSEKIRGFRVLLGGRLGRHPRLAIDIGKVLSEDEVILLLSDVIRFYKSHSKNGERFSKIFNESDLGTISGII